MLSFTTAVSPWISFSDIIVEVILSPHLHLSGKTILITGATNGIGLAAARGLAGMGAEILGVGRSDERCARAVEDIRNASSNQAVHFFKADLSSQRQVHQLALEISKHIENNSRKLDVLVNNAGVVTTWYTATEDGYEMQFAVNHLAPFLLTHQLLPLLQNTPEARVLTVSSRSHRGMRIFWNDVMMRRFYFILLAYKQSKLANVMFTIGLNQRLGNTTGIRAFAIDPGLVNTNIGGKDQPSIVRWVWNLRRQKGAHPSDGAKTLIHVASTPQLDPPDGVYWRHCRSIPPSSYAQRPDEVERLWALSERLCGIEYPGNLKVLPADLQEM